MKKKAIAIILAVFILATATPLQIFAQALPKPPPKVLRPVKPPSAGKPVYNTTLLKQMVAQYNKTAGIQVRLPLERANLRMDGTPGPPPPDNLFGIGTRFHHWIWGQDVYEYFDLPENWCAFYRDGTIDGIAPRLFHTRITDEHIRTSEQMMNFETSFGNVTVPFIPMRIPILDLISDLQMTGEIVTEYMYSHGYYFCQRYFNFFHRDYWDMRPHRPAERQSIFLGTCPITGFAILQGPLRTGSPPSSSVQPLCFTSPIYQAVMRYSVPFSMKFTSVCGNELVYQSTPHSGHMYRFINDTYMRLRSGNTAGNLHNFRFGVLCSTDTRWPLWIQIDPGFTHLSNPNLSRDSTMQIIRSNFQISPSEVPAPIQPRPDPLVNLAPVNALNDMDALIALIREISAHPELSPDYAVVATPYVLPEHFPELSPEELAQLIEEILRQLDIREVVMPGDYVHEILRENPNAIPTLPSPGTEIGTPPQPQPNPQPQPGLTPRDLREIERQLQAQTRALDDIRTHTRNVDRALDNFINHSPPNSQPRRLAQAFMS
ncbi:MAG: hypothetical protein FWB96_13510 [Defluviitaleaceae bacterium]|nr:hypothetical protein [Defluviitaleaceae bacterium]MCL2264338.1 hypothetical protein [Defluviitaleaceae bacterium]